MTAKAPGQIDHPVSIAVERLDSLNPDYIARVRDELYAGAITRDRVRAAINALAGLGAVVYVAVDAVEEVDGQWFGGGQCSGKYVAFPLHRDQAPPMSAALQAGEAVTALIPPVDFL